MSKLIEKQASEAFFKAATKGDVAKIKTLLERGQIVDVRDAAGKTALMRTAERGAIRAASVLLAAGADVNAQVSDRHSIRFGCNALLFAAESGSEESVEMLLKAGASTHAKAGDDTTPLTFAVEHKSARMVKALLAAKVPLPDDILVSSVWNNSREISVLLVGAGADADAKDSLGQPVLHRAAETGQPEVVRALVRAKAKLNPKANGCTPLLAAIQNRHTDCALELIQARADLKPTDLLKRDALMNAAVSGQTEIVRALLKAGADAKARDRSGKTALMLANEKDKPDMDLVNLLRGGGSDDADYNVQEYLRAAMNGDVARVRQFLRAGVDVDVAYQNGAKALISAVKRGHTEVVKLLIELGVDIETKGEVKAWGVKFRSDALAMAAEEGRLEIVRLLIKAGIDVKKSNAWGISAARLAALGGHTEVIRELVAAGASIKGEHGRHLVENAIGKKKEETALSLIEMGAIGKPEKAAGLLCDAVEKGLLRVVKALLQAGVDPKTRNQYDETALQVAEENGRTAIATILRKAVSPKDSPALGLIEAAERGDLPRVRQLILEGVDVESRDAQHYTALMRAAQTAQLPVMKALLDAGADPNAATSVVERDKTQMFHHMDQTFQTPLSLATLALSLPAVNLLLAAGADVRKTECGHIACMILREEVNTIPLIERLLDAGMDPESRWPVIRVSLLECAATDGHTGLVKKLIELGARLKTPLERNRAVEDAVQAGRLELAKLLMERGIAPGVKGVIPTKVLVEAAMNGYDDIVELLLKKGVKSNERVDGSFEKEGPVNGVTALMAAARHGRASTVELLLAAGARPNTEDGTRRTAFDWATDNQSKNIAQRICRLLESAGAKRQ